MNKKLLRSALSLLLSLAILVSLLAGLSLTASAAVLTGTSTGYTKASDVNYETVSGTVANWGVRGETATFLTTYAQSYYTGSYSYATLSALSGSSSTDTSFYSSALGTAIHNMLVAKQTSTTSYDGTRNLYKYTDCVNSNYSYISSFYSGTQLNGAWDSGSTWNREHTWPNSKCLNTNHSGDSADIMMLRPTSVSENSSRGNTAYGSSGSYYDPNSEIGSSGLNLHGDVARLMLQHLMRWGNTDKFYGSGGVMESRAVLLQWMEEDPVDTWEMGRNDSVQSITGVRNVFVDYPELAFKLLGATMPSGYSTPSGGSGSSSSYTVNAISNNTSYGTVSVSGYTITASPKTGYTYANPAYTVTSGSATVTQNGNTFTVNPSSNCTVRINFAAKTSVTVTFSANGSTSTQTGYTGEAMTLPTRTAPSGYTFLGWVTSTVDETQTKPATIYTTTYTPTGSCTLYALYSHTDSAGSGSGSSDTFELVDEAPDDWSGEYVLADESTTYVLLCDGTKSVGSTDAAKTLSAADITKNGTTLSGVTDSYVLVVESVGSGYYSFKLKGSSSNAYLMTTDANNGFGTATSNTGNTAKWSISYTSGTFSITNKDNSRAIKSNTNTHQFRAYTSGQTNVILYAGSSAGTTTYMTSIGGSASCEHTYTAAVTAPTCTAGGYTTYTCTKCGDTYTGDQTAALGHNYTSTVTTAATCGTAGVRTYTCSRCGDSYTEAIAATGNHSYTSAVTAPTCTAAGYTTYTCSVCGDTYTGNTTAALGHSYGAFTSNNNGTHSKTCSRCSDIVTEDCAYTSVTNGATTTFTCTVCAYTYQTTLPTYTVTYNDRGATTSVTCIDGNSVTLPATASTVEGYDFAGWVDAAIPTETTAAPTVRTGAYTPTADRTFYACYTRTDSEPTTTAAEVGNSGSTTSYKAGSPYNFYFCYTTNEMLYTASEIGGAGTITALGFYVASTSGEISPEYVNIYLTTTSGSSLSKNTPYYASDLILVYSGAPTMGSSTGWEMLTLDTPFEYNGTDNLVVVTTQHVANYDNGKVQYRISSAPGCMIYRQSDDNANYGDASKVVSSGGGWGGSSSNGFSSASSRPAVKLTLTTDTTYYTTNPVAPCTHENKTLTGYVAATCTTDGYSGDYFCDTCGEKVTDGAVIPATGHTEVTDAAVAPTCTETGLTAGSHCSVCNTVLTAQEVIPATGHTEVTDAAVAPTCTETGLTAGSHCSVCNTVLTAQEVIPATGHTRSYVDNGDGTHDEVCTVCDTVLTDDEPHVYDNGVCSHCGATEPAVETLQLVSRAPVLNGKIDMTYTVTVPSGYTNTYMVFTFNGTSTTVRDYTTENGNLKFKFAGINPQCMGDNISATLYATKGNSEESLSAGVYSVRQYCVNMLARTGDNAISNDLRTLLSDLLAYGAAAQTYMGYKTNALVNAGDDIINPTCSTFANLSGKDASFTGTADENVYWLSAGLTLTDSVAMRFRFYAASTENLTVTVSVNGKTQSFSDFTAVTGETNVYEVSFTGISAEEFGDSVTASFARSGAAVSNTVSYSVNAYVQSKQADTETANLAALVQALYNYGASAAAYAG